MEENHTTTTTTTTISNQANDDLSPLSDESLQEINKTMSPRKVEENLCKGTRYSRRKSSTELKRLSQNINLKKEILTMNKSKIRKE